MFIKANQFCCVYQMSYCNSQETTKLDVGHLEQRQVASEQAKRLCISVGSEETKVEWSSMCAID